MKNLTFTLLVAGLLLTSTACDKDNLTGFSFTHDYAEFTITVDSTSLQGDLNLGTMEIETDVQGLMSDNGVSVDNLNSVKVKAVNLSIEDSHATPYTFDLLGKIVTEISNTAGSSMKVFAKKDPVPTGGLSTIDLDVQDVELMDYFKLSKIKFNISGFTNGPIEHSFNVKVKMKVKFEGEVIK
ncbi:MAG: hypothetical protein JNL88_04545 [Bacteroidia bacterium]|nr:hypothetical protein [Bacteroidia bacterium]